MLDQWEPAGGRVVKPRILSKNRETPETAMGITVISMIARLKTTERFMKTYQCGGRSRQIRAGSPATRASGCSSRRNWLDPSAPGAVVSDALRPPEVFTMR